jgi:lactate 2-monooxygenase
MRHNREAFERWRIVPRMLRGMPQRDLTISIVGTPLSSLLLLAPIGAGVGGSPEQRRDHCPRAAAAGAGYVISSQGCNPRGDSSDDQPMAVLVSAVLVHR